LSSLFERALVVRPSPSPRLPASDRSSPSWFFAKSAAARGASRLPSGGCAGLDTPLLRRGGDASNPDGDDLNGSRTQRRSTMTNHENSNRRTPRAPSLPDAAPNAEAIELEVIHVYTREQAIEDGVLVDVSDWASPAQMSPGFRCPVAFTRSLWNAIEAIPDRYADIQDVRGRAHDVLFLAALRMKGMVRRDELVGHYAVHMPVKGSRTRLQQLRITFHSFEGVTIGHSNDF
jgi:hypothetical protein